MSAANGPRNLRHHNAALVGLLQRWVWPQALPPALPGAAGARVFPGAGGALTVLG